MLGGPIGILKVVTPIFSGTANRGQFKFKDEDGGINADGIVLKLFESQYTDALNKKMDVKNAKNQNPFNTTEKFLGQTMANKLLDKKQDNSQVQVTTPKCGCSTIFNPVCGGNKKTYGNSCLANCENVEVKDPGFCGSPVNLKPNPLPNPQENKSCASCSNV